MAASFKRFLETYCKQICGVQTTSLRRFAHSVGEHPRLEEPLLLLAIEQGREEYLLASLAEGSLRSRYQDWIGAFEATGLCLREYLETLPEGNRYRKVFGSWLSECESLARDRKTSMAVCRRLNELIVLKGLTRAEACRLSGVNKGNFYAFLKGDVSKLSYRTAVAVFDAIAAS